MVGKDITDGVRNEKVALGDMDMEEIAVALEGAVAKDLEVDLSEGLASAAVVCMTVSKLSVKCGAEACALLDVVDKVLFCMLSPGHEDTRFYQNHFAP